MSITSMNLLDAKKGIIVHQTNCQGVMGAGLAKSIKAKFPVAFDKYKALCNKHSHNTSALLGVKQLVKVDDSLYVCNLFGQDRWGRDKKMTDYRAVKQGLLSLKESIGDKDIDVYFPYKMGCNLGGGDWEIVHMLIVRTFPNAIICKF